MRELEILQDMINKTLDNEIKFTKNEFLNQLTEVVKVITSKDKEIELKNKYIEELEESNKNIRFREDMYKSMIEMVLDF